MIWHDIYVVCFPCPGIVLFIHSVHINLPRLLAMQFPFVTSLVRFANGHAVTLLDVALH